MAQAPKLAPEDQGPSTRSVSPIFGCHYDSLPMFGLLEEGDSPANYGRQWEFAYLALLHIRRFLLEALRASLRSNREQHFPRKLASQQQCLDYSNDGTNSDGLRK